MNPDAPPPARPAAEARPDGPALPAREEVVGWLQDETARFLALDRAPAPDASFIDLGFDSLRAVDFKDLVAARFGLALRSTLLFDHPTPDAVADHVLASLRGDAPAPEAIGDGPPAGGEPVAIVGLACRLPGAADPAAFWRLLVEGRDATSEAPPDRLPPELFDPAPGTPGRTYTRRGGWLDRIDGFDARFFGLAPREVVMLDPQHRLLLEMAWEAIEDAGIAASSLAGSDTGVFTGLHASEYFDSQCDRGPLDVNPWHATGNAISTAAGRISYVLGFTGPCFALDTACSASLVALHAAIQSLRRRECRAALAGGVNLMVDPLTTVSLAQARMLSPGGRCRTFADGADGYARAEGAGLVLLKRLTDAHADGDRVHAVVLGTAINQDGRSGGLTVPHGPSQVAVIRAALRDAGLRPADVDYVEAHGTGTALGDPIEVHALHAAYGAGRDAAAPLLLGSVKTNLGHLETAAGVAGLIKVALALRHARIPKHLHFGKPNPHVRWDEVNVRVVSEETPWPERERPRRAGLSSFGFSGTNAHVILEEAPAAAGRRPPPGTAGRTGRDARSGESAGNGDGAVPDDSRADVLPLSALTPAALTALARRHAAAMACLDATSLADHVFTTATGRARMPHRLALVASGPDALAGLAARAADGEEGPAILRGHVAAAAPPVVFLYTGQGSQRAGMGRDLHATEPAFQAAFDDAAAALRPHLAIPLDDLLWGAATDRLDATENTQPALFALGYALTRLWAAHGIAPAAVLGHSVGDYAAACAAGILSLEDAAALVAARGRLMRELAPPGAMLAVGASEEVVAPLVARDPAHLAVAALNAPDQVTVAGAPDAVARLARELAERRIAVTPVPVSRAFHSPLMEPMLGTFAALARQRSFAAPALRFVSALDGGPAHPEWWVRHVRETVRFREALRQLAPAAGTILVEIGPAPVLLGLARRNGLDGGTAAVPTLRPGVPEAQAFALALARAWTAGAPVDWHARFAGVPVRVTTVPTYPFERERWWLERRSDRARTASAGSPTPESSDADALHPLLGRPVASSLLGPGEALFESAVSSSRPAWLADHVAFGHALVPAAGFLEIGLSAAARRFGIGDVAIENVSVHAPLLAGDDPATVQVHVKPAGAAAIAFRILGRPAGAGPEDAGTPWTLHAEGAARAEAPGPAEPPIDLDAVRARCPEVLDSAAFYRILEDASLAYGPAFRAVTEVRRGATEVLARIALPAAAGDSGRFRVHPAVLDACFQTAAALIVRSHPGDPWLPLGVGTITVQGRIPEAATCHLRLLTEPAKDVRALAFDVALHDDDGRAAVVVRGLQLVRADRAALLRARVDVDRLLHVERWTRIAEPPEAVAPAPGAAEAWIVRGDDPELRERLAEAFRAAGRMPIDVAAEDGVAAALDAAAREGARPAGVVLLAGTDARSSGGPVPGALPDGPPGSPTDSAAPGPRSAPARAHASPRDSAAGPATAGGLLTDAVAAARAILARGATPPPRLVLVTRGAAPAGPPPEPVDPAGAVLRGLAATLAQEHPEIRVLHLDLAPRPESGEGAAIARASLAGDAEPRLALRSGRLLGARLERARRPGARAAASSVSATPGGAGPVRLRLEAWGALDRLAWTPAEARAPEAGEVAVRVRAAGLNFKDVVFALGLLRDVAEARGIRRAGDLPLGFEASGVVESVGPGVAGFAAGDPVIVSAEGAFASRLVVPAAAVAGLPEGVDPVAAAGVQTVFFTALHALERLAALRPGETVLVHAAAGGVGQAAVQVAQRAGATVLATASPAKWEHLRSQGIAHVFSSRTPGFGRAVREATGGRGVDVVLNCLAGPFVAEGLSALAPGGRFIEIGRLGAWTAEQAAELRPDVRYERFDLSEVLAARPELLDALRADLLAGLAAGTLRPVPVTAYPAADAAAAFSALAGARHTGKVVLDFGAGAGEPRRDRTWLVTGGLGALGLAVAGHLARSGRRSLVLAGRRPPSAEAEAAIAGLRAAGAEVSVRAVDVADRAALGALLDGIRKTLPPLGGVVHAAGVLDDAVLANLAPERLAAVLAPKVDGAWNLHELTRDDGLDAFVLAGSLAGMTGAAGQAAYAAANAFLGALAHHRRRQGLPAVAAAFGPWAGAGMAARLDERNRARLAQLGVRMLAPEEGLAALDRLLADGEPETGVFAVDWVRFAAALPAGGRPYLDALLPAAPGTSDRPREDLLAALRPLPPAERRARLAAFVDDRLARVLGFGDAQGFEPDRSFIDLGVDSLLAVDLKNRVENGLGIPLPASLVFDHPTPGRLVEHLALLVAGAGDPAPPQGGTRPDDGKALESRVQEILALDEDEIARRLAAELGAP